MDLRLELVMIPVTDVDRAKAFYVDKVGFVVDHDQRVTDTLRFVQLTPPGSACSIAIGEGITDAEAGSVKGMQMVTSDIVQAHTDLNDQGLKTGDIEDLEWGRFLYFSDPDGNQWAIQELPVRD